MSHHEPPPGPYGNGQPGQSGQPGASGPYGAPPPNPYAQGGGVPGQPGYGYPQQPPQPQPQQGFGAPQPPGPAVPPPYSGPEPQAQPYGAPYAPQPPLPQPPQGGGSGGGRGRTISIIAGAVVIAGAIIGGALVYAGGGSSDEAGKVDPYEIVATHSVLDGEYTETDGGPDDTVKDSETQRLGVENGTAVSVAWKSGSEGDLRLAGAYGKIDEPEKAADAMFALLHKSQDDLKNTIDNFTVETVRERTEYSPDGFDGAVLACETQRQSGEVYGQSMNVEFSTCVWADTSAVAAVSQSGPQSSSGTFGEAMPQDDLAEATVSIREDTRKESKEK